MRPFDVPVGLPALQLHIDRVGQAAVQQIDEVGPLILGQDIFFG